MVSRERRQKKRKEGGGMTTEEKNRPNRRRSPRSNEEIQLNIRGTCGGNGLAAESPNPGMAEPFGFKVRGYKRGAIW